MRWTPGGRSDNLEDRRDDTGGAGLSFGGSGLHLGIGGFILVAVLSLIFRTNFFALLGGGGVTTSPTAVSQPDTQRDAREEPEVRFVSFVLDDTQNTWRGILQKNGAEYRDAKLVLFRDRINSGCGFAQAATGPFYCPEDHKVYIDLSFYDELKQRLGGGGDFAQAYVLAHEIGHHVQNLLGIDQKVRQVQQGRPDQANTLSVRMELQADCFAGIWGHSTEQRNLLEQGDVEEAINTAAAIGDDRLQRMAGRAVNPDAFTHGSSKDRVAWFERGFKSGDLSSCNTFAQ
jgi:hypothetical protein